MATAADLITIRDWCGSHIATPEGAPFDAADVDARLAMYGGDPLLVALSIAKRQLSDMVRDAAQWDADGDTSENWTANLKLAQGRVSDLEELTASGTAATPMPSLGVSQLTRADRGRSGPCRSPLL